MGNALIGYSGYVGTTLLKQRTFDELYRSTNIADIAGRSYDFVICSAAHAQKWIANREPAADQKKLSALMTCLRTIRCARFVLISTVDVFKDPRAVNEESVVEEAGLHPYGLHRRMLERFVEQYFPDRLVVRLPGLVGPGLRKNVLFDLLNGNNVSAIDCRGVFQFYPMVQLWSDLQTALDRNLKLVHLTAEPISVAEVCVEAFGRGLDQSYAGAPPMYDVRSNYACLFGGHGDYQYSKRESILAIRAYAQSESRTLRADANSEK